MQDETVSRNMKPIARVSLTDQVFDQLQSKILSLDLPPGTKLSEAEVAKQLEVSRQVARDAFYRLSRLGFLIIRPQKATLVSKISVNDVIEARYVRMALECENVRNACLSFDNRCLEQLESLLDQQRVAIDDDNHKLFHQLDNEYHRQICIGSGFEFSYPIILERKAHTDRVRFLSVAFSSQEAFEGHVEILSAIKKKNTDKAIESMRDHLSQIESAIDHLREENHEWFEDL